MEILVSEVDGSCSRALALAPNGSEHVGARSGRLGATQGQTDLGLYVCGVGRLFLPWRPPVNPPLRNKAQYQSNMTASFQWIDPGLQARACEAQTRADNLY